jgi:fibronectin-binding autotransporter adhesin
MFRFPPSFLERKKTTYCARSRFGPASDHSCSRASFIAASLTAKRLHDPILSSRAFAIFFFVTILIAIAFLLAPKARAANDLYWDANGTAANGATTTATGTWGTSNFWNSSSTGTGGTLQTTTANTNDLHFSSGTNYTGSFTVTVNGARSANSIIFEEGTLTLSGGTSITLGGGGGVNSGLIFNSGTGANTISTAIILGSTAAFTNNDDSLQTISGTVNNGVFALTLANTSTGGITLSNVISGSGAVTINNIGTGVTTFSNTGSTYSGQLTVQSGTLSIDTANDSGSNGELGNNGNAVILGGSGTTGTLEYTGVTDASSKKFTMALGGTGVFQVDTAATTLTLSGVIDGSGGLTKTGAGTLSLNALNTYSGDTTINGGTLLLGNAAGIPSGTGKGNVIIGSSGTLSTNDKDAISINGLSGGGVVQKTGGSPDTITLGNNNANGSFSGVLQDGGSTHELVIIKTGSGTQTFSGNNTYAGATTIQNGILSVSSLNKVSGGSASSNLGHPITVANGTIAIGATTNTGQLTYTGTGETTDRVINLAGTTGGATLDQSGTGTLTFSSNFTATGAGSKTLTLQGSTAGGGVINGAIVDNSGTNKTSLVKTGSGTWTLGGTNLYTGLTNITAGTLAEGVSNAISTGAVTVNGATAVFDLGANHTDTVGIVTLDGGGSITGTGTSALTSTGSFEMKSGSDSAILAGSGIALNKTTAGTVTLTGANTYSGTTTISAGTLSLSGASTNNIASSTTIVDNATLNVTGLTGSKIVLASGQTLKGGGTVTGGVDIGTGAILSPGNSPGTLSTGATSYNGGGTYVWEINNTSGSQGSDPGWDWNNITGTLTIGATSSNKFNVDISGLNTSDVAGVVSNFNKYASYSWNIATASGGISGFAANAFTLATTNFTNNNSITGTASNGSFSITTVGNNLVLDYTGAIASAPTGAYWKGGQGSVWSTNNAGATNWVDGPAGVETNQVPGATSNVFFTANSASNFASTTLGADFTINSLTFTGTGTSATSAVGIGGGNLLTINATNANGNTAGNGITVQTGSGNHTISSNVALGGNQTWTVTDAATTLTASGAISGGSNTLTKAGAGTLLFSGSTANIYTGLTTVSAGELDLNKTAGVNAIAGNATVNGGTLKLLGSNQIANTSAVTVSGGTFDIGANSDTVGAVTLTSGNINGAGGTLTGSSYGVESGNVSAKLGGGAALTKTTIGTVVLTGANTYTGTTTINAGTLTAGAANALGGTPTINVANTGILLLADNTTTNHINDSAAVNLAGGSKFDTAGFSEGIRPTSSVSNDGVAGMATLSLSGTSGSPVTFDFGTNINGSSLVFSSLAGTSAGTYVTILNWDGQAGSDNGSTSNDRLLFATDPNFSLADLSNFTFTGYNPGAMEITYGNMTEIVPLLVAVPEPGTWFAAALALGAIGYVQLRKRSRVAKC